MDSEFQTLVGFRIPCTVFRIPIRRIPDFTSKNFSDSGICIPLHGASQMLCQAQPGVPRVSLPQGCTLAFSSERKLGILYAGNLKLPVNAERAYVEEGEGSVTLGLA